MHILRDIRDRSIGALVGAQVGAEALIDHANALEEANIRSQENLADLILAEDDVGWNEYGASGANWQFPRGTLRKITARSRLMYLVNPLIRRAVTVQELYVWGSGVEIKAEDKNVGQVLADFFFHPKNQRIVGEAWPEREREQRIDGNTFLVFHLNKVNGTARVRVIPVDQITDIICNPDDAMEPWYYSRVAETGVDLDGVVNDKQFGSTVLYPDIDYNPKVKPSSNKDGAKIMWDTRVLHIRTGGLAQMKFGMPELYSTLNWATAYKGILENFATILKAYSRMAMKMSGLTGKKGIAAAKSKLNTKITSGNYGDSNPPTNTAGWMMLSGGVDVQAIKTAGSTTGPDEARALRSMVAAGSDTPEHFFGDSDIGNFATSTTLDRPTELKMVSRQLMWKNVISHICRKLIEWSTLAPMGVLRQANFRATIGRDIFDGTRDVIITPPSGGSLSVEVAFPTILDRDVTDRVRAVVQAATLGGSPAEGIIPDRKYLFKLLMEALGKRDAEALMEKFYPEPVTQGFIDPAQKAEDDHLTALGRKALGDAAIKQADVAKTNAEKPTPKPVAAASAVNK